jgi:hypothetical protein
MPWRYPGITPVTDSCGVAGGIVPGQQPGVAGADYTETPLAKLGDLGSRLPPMPTGTVWTARGMAAGACGGRTRNSGLCAPSWAVVVPA